MNDPQQKPGLFLTSGVVLLVFVTAVYDEYTETPIMSFSETLRKYPPATFISRVAVADYQMPGTNITIEKGTDVIIPILAIHHDPEYHPDPEKFDPERFSDDNKQRQLPFSYMPFGEGPRICIGLRFGLMQVKVGLVSLLKNFKFQLNGKTQVPLEMKAYSFTLTSKNEILLDVEKVC